jgi:hypothetical protein
LKKQDVLEAVIISSGYMLLPYNLKIGRGRRLIQAERVAGIGEAVLAYLWINGRGSPPRNFT